MNKNKKGFTLVELLIVIGILAILTAAIVVVLNPAELLRQARDSQRMSDLDSVRSAITLYLTSAASPDLNFASTGEIVNCMVATKTSPFSISGHGCGGSEAAATSRAIDGTGWISVSFEGVTGGSPLSILPQDPTNDASHFYAYAANDTTNVFEIDTVLESTKYAGKMASSSDGGNNENFYEVGTSLTL
jgi:prepilin-type N-terminal cleavage/methylation domain-containing protein